MERDSAERTIAALNDRRRQMACRIRERGRVDYVVRYGLLRVGAAATLVLWLGTRFNVVRAAIPIARTSSRQELWYVIASIILGALLGATYGIRMWRVFERTWFREFDARRDD